MNPLEGNPLVSRSDLQRAVRDLVGCLDTHANASGAFVVPGVNAATYSTAGAGLEGFARRLWGLAPLAAGGGAYDGWARVRDGLAAGTDPAHPDYWGDPTAIDVRLVEMASLGTALALAGPHIWDPLPASVKQNVVRYLNFANTQKLVDNNWQFFCVLANMGLEAVGEKPDRAATATALAKIEAMYLDAGWYTDGHTRQRDYYVAFGMHYYSLLYAAVGKGIDTATADVWRERARLFAKDFAHWFAADGAALPFGRSLTYRFAQGSFWSALAYAGVEALPWGVMKGLVLRHLRWWAKQPIFTETGVLSLGYAYPNLTMCEQYNAPGSPYWALKLFLSLALPESHPFWQAEELPLPAMDELRAMPHAGMVVCRDSADDNVVALATGQWQSGWPMRQSEAKYSKFAYSTGFGFCIDIGQAWADNMLCFSEDGRRWQGRHESIEHRLTADEIYSRWKPITGVEVQTWLRPYGRWHLRIHRITTSRTMRTVEAGFAANVGERDFVLSRETTVDAHSACVHGVSGSSGLVDLSMTRKAELSAIEPNVNLLYARTIAPLLSRTIEAGEYVFVTAVLGVRGRMRFDADWTSPPRLDDIVIPNARG